MLPWCSLPDRVALVLIRHGRTAWNAQRRFLGSTDVPLDEVGQLEAQRLGTIAAGTFEAIYSSPLSRARQTATALAPPSYRIVEDLRELDLGQLEGLAGPEALQRHPEFLAAFREGDPTDLRVPGGETMGELLIRAERVLREIASRHRPGERVAVVTHQMVIASLTCSIVADPLMAWRSHGVVNASASTLAWDGQGFTLVSRGWIPHETP